MSLLHEAAAVTVERLPGRSSESRLSVAGHISMHVRRR